ncbi:cytidylyltransferase domain-containing protein [Salibacterium sp. K-3]
MVKKIGIIQARLSSKRLPGKVMKDLSGKTLLERVIDQVNKSEELEEVWVATSTSPSDDIISLAAKQTGVQVYRGSLENVLQRYCDVIEKSAADIVVRVTADNPFTESTLIDNGIKELIMNDYDYLNFNNIPYGSGIEVIHSDALINSLINTSDETELEHVTKYIKNNSHIFNIKTLSPNTKYMDEDARLTIDTLSDYVRMYKLHNLLVQNNKQLNLKEAISYYHKINI